MFSISNIFELGPRGGGRNFSIISEIQNILNYPRGPLIGNFSQFFPFFLVTPPLSVQLIFRSCQSFNHSIVENICKCLLENSYNTRLAAGYQGVAGHLNRLPGTKYLYRLARYQGLAGDLHMLRDTKKLSVKCIGHGVCAQCDRVLRSRRASG